MKSRSTNFFNTIIFKCKTKCFYIMVFLFAPFFLYSEELPTIITDSIVGLTINNHIDISTLPKRLRDSLSRDIINSLKLKKWRDSLSQPTKPEIERINDQLANFGYQLVGPYNDTRCSPSYDLLKGASIVLSRLCAPTHFQVSNDRKSFLFNTMLGNALVKNGKLYEWDQMKQQVNPMFLGNSVLTVEKLKHVPHQTQDSLKEWYTFAVKKDSTIIFNFKGWECVNPAVQSLLVWKNDWILEYNGHVVINGIDIGSKHGYSEVFNYCYLNKKPFYFFEDKNKNVRISFNGHIIKNAVYDRVLHYQCCDHAVKNPRWSERQIKFYAKYKNTSYFVVVTIF